MIIALSKKSNDLTSALWRFERKKELERYTRENNSEIARLEQARRVCGKNRLNKDYKYQLRVLQSNNEKYAKEIRKL